MTTEKSTPQSEAKPQGRTLKKLDAETAAMLESEEMEAISGEGEDWWCPNPDCKIVDK